MAINQLQRGSLFAVSHVRGANFSDIALTIYSSQGFLFMLTYCNIMSYNIHLGGDIKSSDIEGN